MANVEPTRLLGFLATTTLRGHLEVAATRGLAWMLNESTDLETRMLALLARGEVPVTAHLEWFAEEVLEDSSRPDIEGRLPGTADPVVRVEAKFTAALTDDQLVSYSPTPVVVLHPAFRAREVAEVIGAAADRVEGAQFGSMTWDDLFEALTAGLADGVDRENVAQLRDLADQATGLDVLPFSAEDSVESIASRQEDLSTLAERASAIRGPQGGRLLPATRDRWFHVARYIPTAQPWWAVMGLRKNWQQLDPVTPFWLRFHHDTTDFARLRAGWDAMSDRLGGRLEAGHLFFPLDLPRDVAGVATVRSLQEQVSALVERLGAASLSSRDAPSSAEGTASPTGGDETERLWSLVDRASRLLNDKGRLWPLGADGDFERRRYFPAGTAGSEAAVGLRRGWSSRSTNTPVWLRFHEKTRGFTDIVDRWTAAGRPDGGELDRHLFFPLNVGLAAPDALEQLTRRRDELVGRYAG